MSIIRWGQRAGHQRYKCRDCGASFVKHKAGVRQSNRLVWFRKWVLGKQTIEDIAQESGYSSRQLHRWFDEYLDTFPSWTIKTSTPIYLLIDGTYYSDNHCLIVYRAENLKRTIFYRFTTHEDDDEIASDLLNIRDLGYVVVGITTDGGDNIIRAVQYVFPNVPRQRCVVHVQRECLTSITQHPRSAEAKLFRNLVQQLSIVDTNNDKLWWLSQYNRWTEDNLEYVFQKGVVSYSKQEYYVHNDLRKAYIHLKRALPNLFTYIDHPGVPKTTNALEAFFGHIKDQIRLHRGLAETRIDNFIKWFLFFNDEKKKK
ncbi:MAG: transposase [Bacteroidales bacterium]|nr:transposase [Bacteroidales bacterium]